MTALPEQQWHEAIMTPNNILNAMKQLPEYKTKENELIAAGIETIEDRQALARKIAELFLQSMPASGSQTLETLQAEVLTQLEELKNLLLLEQEEILRKAEVMAAIEKDPQKKSLLIRATNMAKEGWETANKHKFKILFALAAIAGGVAVWYYWDYLALLFTKAGFGAAGAADTGIAGGAEVAAEGAATQAEVVGAAVQKFLEEAASHATDFAIVDHDLFHKGVKYSLKAPHDVSKITEILKGLGKDPDAVIRILCSKTARASTESDFIQLMEKHLPAAVFKNKLCPSTFIEDMVGLPPTLVP